MNNSLGSVRVADQLCDTAQLACTPNRIVAPYGLKEQRVAVDEAQPTMGLDRLGSHSLAPTEGWTG